jgi:hypothetical protein
VSTSASRCPSQPDPIWVGDRRVPCPGRHRPDGNSVSAMAGRISVSHSPSQVLAEGGRGKTPRDTACGCLELGQNLHGESSRMRRRSLLRATGVGNLLVIEKVGDPADDKSAHILIGVHGT